MTNFEETKPDLSYKAYVATKQTLGFLSMHSKDFSRRALEELFRVQSTYNLQDIEMALLGLYMKKFNWSEDLRLIQILGYAVARNLREQVSGSRSLEEAYRQISHLCFVDLVELNTYYQELFTTDVEEPGFESIDYGALVDEIEQQAALSRRK